MKSPTNTAFLRRGSGRVRSVALTVFGKAPFQAEFLEPLGSDTELLIRTRHAFIESMEQANKEWQLWKNGDGKTSPAPEKVMPGFDHSFVWLRPDRILFGRLWNSEDQVKRRFPLVVCAEVTGATLESVLDHLWPALEKLQIPLQKVTGIEDIKELSQRAAREASTLLNKEAGQSHAENSSPETRKLFLERPEFGPEKQGWLRIFHSIQQVFTDNIANQRIQVRVPLGTSSRAEGVRLWAELLAVLVGGSAPIWLIIRNGSNWLDVGVGEPGPEVLTCLQASTKALPLATEIPYEIAPEVPKRFAELEAFWLTGRRKQNSKKVLLAVALIALGALAAWFVFMRGRAKIPPEQHERANPGVSASPAPPPNIQQTVLPPTNAEAMPRTNSVGSAQEGRSETPPPLEPKLNNPELTRALAAAQEAEKSANFTSALAFYWGAQKLDPTDLALVERIKALTPKAQEQTRLAEEQGRRQQVLDANFRRAMDSAAAAAARSDYSNASMGYRQALLIKDDPAARAGQAEMQQKMQAAATQFQDALTAARQAEAAKDYPKALVAYRTAQAIQKDDAQIADRIKALTGNMAQAQEENRAAEQFGSLLTAGKQAEQAGNFTNALNSFKVAQQIRPTNAEVQALIEEVTPKAEKQQRDTAEMATTSKLQSLDGELEVLMVRFGLVRSDQAKTELARKTQLISGALSMADLNNYLRAVSRIESAYKAGGWLEQEQRNEKIKKLIASIQTRN